MSTIVTRTGKGSPLTFAEMDANLTNLNTDKLDSAAIGVTIQGYDAQLVDVAGLTPTDNGVVIGDGTHFVVESGATLKTSLGLTIGTDVQAYNANTIAVAPSTSGNVLTSNGSNWTSATPSVGINSPIRQTVLTGASTSGAPSAIAIGTGLAVNLVATATPLVISAANGFGTSGSSDQIEVLNADVTGLLTLPANNLSFLYRTLATTWGQTLAPPQYGNTYTQSAQSCLSLNNISTDDFGNTWTNTAVTFSNASPAIAGTYMGVFNGTTAFMRSTGFSSLGSGSWTIREKIKITNVATSQMVINAGVSGATQYGVYVQTLSSKLTLWLSSTGSSWDIASAIAGNTTLVNGTAYDVEITYDAIVGKYFVYLNGVIESNLTITSALRICAIHNITVGASCNATPSTFTTGSIQGFEFLPYCVHPNGTTFTPSTTLASVSAAGYASDWFSLNDYKTYSVSGASAVAGTNPTFTQKTRCYVGEATTAASTVISPVTYAYQGKYDSGFTTTLPGTATKTSKNHNIGVKPARVVFIAECTTAESGWAIGEQYATDRGMMTQESTISRVLAVGANALSCWITTSTSVAFLGLNESSGASFTLTAASWKWKFVGERGW